VTTQSVGQHHHCVMSSRPKMDTPAAVAHVRKPPKKREMTMPVAHNYRVASQEVTTKDVAGFVNTKNLTATQRKKQKYYQEIQKPMNELMKEIKDNAKKKIIRRATKAVKEPQPQQPKFEVGDKLCTFVERLTKTHIGVWQTALMKHIRVFCKATFPSRQSLTGPQIDGDEIFAVREYVIGLKLKDKIFNLYEVRQSGLAKAHMGLFAKRAFKFGEVMGVYFGKIIKHPVKTKEKLSCYAMKFDKHGVTMDCQGGIDSKYPTYFGLQFANDPSLVNNMRTRSSVVDNPHNFFVDENFVARALRDIKIGEELFMYYGWTEELDGTDGVNCDCTGCVSCRMNFEFE
jgi:hypothetical protein